MASAGSSNTSSPEGKLLPRDVGGELAVADALGQAGCENGGCYFGNASKGRIAVGDHADLTVIDLTTGGGGKVGILDDMVWAKSRNENGPGR